ncbi:hypothetical protein STTU_4323 [Streptomyces sp. Tu6071]|nr:hypothetical protein STTU_4323 [Streptomyces sp. Tu6071]
MVGRSSCPLWPPVRRSPRGTEQDIVPGGVEVAKVDRDRATR